MAGVLNIFEGGRKDRKRKKGERKFIHFTRTRGASELRGYSKETAREKKISISLLTKLIITAKKKKKKNGSKSSH